MLNKKILSALLLLTLSSNAAFAAFVASSNVGAKSTLADPAPPSETRDRFGVIVNTDKQFPINVTYGICNGPLNTKNCEPTKTQSINPGQEFIVSGPLLRNKLQVVRVYSAQLMNNSGNPTTNYGNDAYGCITARQEFPNWFVDAMINLERSSEKANYIRCNRYASDAEMVQPATAATGMNNRDINLK
jgi:hypothetical protein